MKQRKKISLGDTVQELCIKMGEGNPGGLSVVMELMQREFGLFTILRLDDMDIRGGQIWVAYKDYCSGNLDRLIDAVNARDMKMLSVINRECPDRVAVISGASFER